MSVEDTKAHSAALGRLLAVCMEASYPEPLVPEFYEKKLRDLTTYLENEQACVLAALDDNKNVQGFLWGYLLHSPVGIKFHIAYFAVMPETRRCGIGGKLLQAAEREARAMGSDRCELIVSASNTSAREFYCEQGFQTVRLILEKPMENS